MIDWIMENYMSLWAILGAVVTVASLVVPLTPTPKDDSALAFLKKLLDRFSVFMPKSPRA